MQPKQAPSYRGLSTAGFPDQSEGLASKKIERNIINRLKDVIAILNWKMFYEMANLDE
jgi:hypothetical protein